MFLFSVVTFITMLTENLAAQVSECTREEYVRDNGCTETKCAFTPPAPSVSANFTKVYPIKKYVLYSGEEVRVFCEGLTDEVGYIEFILELPKVLNYDSKPTRRHYLRADKDVLHYIQDRKLRKEDGGKCRMYSSATLKLPVTSNMERGHFSCCMHYDAPEPKCSSTPTIALFYKERKPILDIKYDHGPKRTAGSLMKARCKAFVGTYGQLIVARTTRAYYMKITLRTDEALRKSTRYYEDGSILIIHKRKHHANYGPELTVDFSFLLTIDMDDMQVECIVYRTWTSGKITVKTANYPLEVLCLDPYPPNTTVHFHKKPGIVRGGNDVKVTCAVIAHRGNTAVELWLNPASREGDRKAEKMFRNSSLPRKGAPYLPRPPEMLGYGAGCFTLVEVPFKFKAKGSLQGSNVGCCDYLKGRKRCDPSDAFNVIFSPRHAELDIEYQDGNTVIKASCSAYVGSAGGLAWEVSRADARVLWVQDKGGTISVEGEQSSVGEVLVQPLSVIYDEMNGPKLRSELTLTDTNTKGLQDALVSCFVYDIMTRKIVELSGSSKEGKTIEFSPKLPNLKVKYHVEPYKVGYGKKFELNCFAYVGSYSVLSWAISSPSLNRSWALTVKGPFNIEDTELGLRITSKTGHSKWSGPSINSSLTIRVSDHLDAATIECYPYNVSDKNISAMFGTDNLFAATKPLTITYLPWPPLLKPMYHHPPDIVYATHPLHIVCEAHVGVDGAITWVLLTDTYIQTWLINSAGELSQNQGHAEDISITHSPATKGKLGPHLSSTFTVEVTFALHGAVIGCYSYDASSHTVFDSKTDKLANFTLSLVVQTSLSRTLASTASELLDQISATSMLGTGAVLLLGIYLCRRGYQRKPPENLYDEPASDRSEESSVPDFTTGAGEMSVSEANAYATETSEGETTIH